MRIFLGAAVAATLFATGCSACGEKAAEMITAKALGVDSIDVDSKTGAVKIKGKDGEEIRMAGDGDQGTFVIKSKDGEFHLDSGGGGKVPEGFPFALAKGAKIQGSASQKKGDSRSFFLSHLSADDVETVAAFYEKELSSKGLEIERNEMELNGKKMITLGARTEKREATVSVSDMGEEGVTATISVQDKI